MYHDLQRVEYVLKNGFIDKYIYSDMRLLALYYRDYLGYSPAKREKELYDFCRKHIANFNEIMYYQIIDKALAYAKKKDKKIIEIDHVDIYKHEMEFIDNLPLEADPKKILFTLLVKIKLNGIAVKMISGEECIDFYTSRTLKEADIVKMANLDKKSRQDAYFFLLESEGYITTYHTGSMKIDVFYDIVVPENDEVIFSIRDYNNIGWHYDYLHNRNNIRLCTICSAPFKANAHNSKYCDEHKPKVIKTRKVVCIDCGEEFEVSSHNAITLRCGICQAKRNKELNRVKSRERMKKYREQKQTR